MNGKRAQELHYDFHVCNTAGAIRKKFTGSCWNVLIQVKGKKEGEGLKVMLKSGRTWGHIQEAARGTEKIY